jgi:hypothetical protein
MSTRKAIDRFVRENSVLSSCVAGFCFGGCGDLIAQRTDQAGRVSSAERTTDLQRTFLVASYYGVAALFWHPFYGWMDRAFVGTGSVAKKVFVDNFIALPFLDIPAFYTFTLGPRCGFDEALARLQEDYTTSLMSGWALWVPTTAIVFKHSPAHLRLPIFFAVETAWAGALSFISNASRSAPEKQVNIAPVPHGSGYLPK